MVRTVTLPPNQPALDHRHGDDGYHDSPYSMPPLPPVSSRGGHGHPSHHHPQAHYHPYARPDASPYGDHPGHPPSMYYDYYAGGERPYAPPHMTQPHPSNPGPHLVDSSPRDGHDGNLVARHHRPMPSHPASASSHNKKAHPEEKESKKPPRPYTEYNIFFQLERERILGELEKEQQKGLAKEQQQEGEGGEDAKEAGSDPSETADDGPKDATVVLNRPSDANDILPRPPRFAHLLLSPLWYDSTHRLKENKRNKARRKHRKTHGLVGFLELTRLIAGAWREVDPDVKAYCKRVADRQLAIYKEETKALKTREKWEDSRVVARKESVPSAAASAVPPPPYEAKGRGRPHQEAMPPPPPPPPPGAGSHYGYGKGSHYRYDKYWQHPPQQYSYPAASHSHHHPSTGRPYYPPSIPPLTPTSEHPDALNGSHHGGGGTGTVPHTPLDELMHRRMMYGSRAAAREGTERRRSPGTSRQERLERAARNGTKRREGATKADHQRPTTGAPVQSAASYLSPSDTAGAGSPNEAFRASGTAAITPSPSRRHAGTLQSPSSTGTDAASAASPTTPSQGPMKKRLKKQASAGIDASSPTESGKAGSTPNETSPKEDAAASPLFTMSPTAMTTPGRASDPFALGGASPLSGGSGYRKALVGPYLTGADASPFPYIDWSPHDRSPQDGGAAGGQSPPLGPTGHPRMPPHLAVPGAYGPPPPSSHPSSHFPHPGRQSYPSMPTSPYLAPLHDDLGDDGALDLDEEEMQLLWRRLATCAKRKRMRERDAAAAWLGYYGGGGSFAASPGGLGPGRVGMAHSFSSPVERPEAAGAVAASGAAVVAKLGVPSPDEDNEDETDTKAQGAAADSVEEKEVPLKEES